jgi:hypothetical protein
MYEIFTACKMLSSGMWCRIFLVTIDVSEERRASIVMVEAIREVGRTLAVTSNWVTANVVPSSLILSTLIIDAIRSSEPSVLTRATQRHITEDGILHSHRHENLRPYIALTGWALQRRHVSPVRYERSFYIPGDCSVHSHRRETHKSYVVTCISLCWTLRSSGYRSCIVFGWFCIQTSSRRQSIVFLRCDLTIYRANVEALSRMCT